MRKRLTTIGVFTIAAVLIACGAVTNIGNKATAQDGAMMEDSPFQDLDRAVAVLHPTEGNDVRGVVHFEQEGEQVQINATVRGLEPGSTHGIHIHEFGDCTADDGTSAGGHYDPEGTPHGLPPDENRHAGDLGNLTANDEGVAELDLTVDNVTIAGNDNPVIGRGMIVHGQEDDGGQPTGNAGARLACGVIGVAQPAE